MLPAEQKNLTILTVLPSHEFLGLFCVSNSKSYYATLKTLNFQRIGLQYTFLLFHSGQFSRLLFLSPCLQKLLRHTFESVGSLL